MELYVHTAKVRFNDEGISEAELFFNIREDDKTFDLDGYLPISAEKYINNFQGNKLAEVVRDELIERLQNADVKHEPTGDDDTDDEEDDN